MNTPMLQQRLTYTPTELGFGTSGLRGLVTDMTDLECFVNVTGFLAFLKDKKSITVGDTVSIGGDLRKSTPRIMRAVTAAIEHAGYVAESCGYVPTPTLALWAIQHNQASIMVTGSHIPADRNGIKFYTPTGEILKSDELAIKESVRRVRRDLYESNGDMFSADGELNSLPVVSAVTNDASRQYLKRYTDIFPATTFKNRHIIVYQHSAVGRDLLVELFQLLGATVTAVDRTEKFVPIDTENVTPDDQAHFVAIAQEYPDAFAIISTDGDSDRPFVIDESGTFHRGDVVGAIVAKALHADFAAIPISSSDAVDTYMKQNDVTIEHTKIGSPYVIEAMNTAPNDAVSRVGWEVNGGFLTGSPILFNNVELSPLATRDAFLPILMTLYEAVSKNVSVSELMAQLPKRATQAGLIDNFEKNSSTLIVQKLGRKDKAAFALISDCFTIKNGFGKPTNINTTDGIRIFFDNNEIAHIRPSGNAPQLRIYSVADTQQRADQIVELGIAENGILRALETAVKN
jgi:phosphomannomutase